MDLLRKWGTRTALLLVAAGPVVSAPEHATSPEAAHQSRPMPQSGQPSTSPANQPSEPVLPLTVDQIAGHLGQTADWFHHVTSLQGPSVDSSSRDRVHQQALTAVQLALEFGRACAKLLRTVVPDASKSTGPAAAGANSFAGRLDEAAANIDQRVMALQSELDGLDQQIAAVRGKGRETLLARKAQVSAALTLAREVQESVQAMEDFEASSIADDRGSLSPIEGKIADIERSIPEVRSAARRSRSARTARTEEGARAPREAGKPEDARAGPGPKGDSTGNDTASSGPSSGGTSGAAASPSNSTRATIADNQRVESAGVITLISDWLSLNDSRRQLSAIVKETDKLQDEIEKVRGQLVGAVRDVIGKDLAISTATDQQQLLAQRAALEADTDRFRQLSTVLVPIGEQALVLESAKSMVDDWRANLNTRMAAVVRYLALRISIVLGWVAVVLVISDVWRRATFRYLHDQRRRRQFLVLRRVAVGLALTLIILFGLVSEIGSVATYAGFVTAGVAVALQNVILAVVAYFFFIGRYGVRVGDRITLSGVTGRVVEIGLVRIYLMELAGADLHATGRMVVLSNSVLFQPAAMFKQIPGADYVWHTVTLTIAATADVVEAHKRLKAAADEVYEKYRDSIERQHALMQNFIDFDAPAPRPEVRVRLTENGLECSVRYPVMLDSAAVIDQQMLKALREALEHDSQFKLVSAGAVVLKSSDT